MVEQWLSMLSTISLIHSFVQLGILMEMQIVKQAILHTWKYKPGGSGESDGLRRLLSFSMACCSSKETQLRSTMSIIAEA
ncbi:hypothetical protein ZWY2020_003990 [Hordeum vulgare]|nr:hypothetical protein ZWY2020_003990 [Hordeum vulgare]